MQRSLDELRAEGDRLEQLLESGVREQLLALPDVVHVAVGLREVNGIATDDFSIKVYVQEKLPATELSAERMVPATVAQVPTDVCEVVRGVATAVTDDARHRPLLGGSLITNGIEIVDPATQAAGIGPGTLGFVALHGDDHVVLTCAHVVIPGGGAVGDPIFQPRPAPGAYPPGGSHPKKPTTTANQIGTIIGKPVIDGTVDCAIAQVNICHSWCCTCGTESTHQINGLQVKIGNAAPVNSITGTGSATPGTFVIKVGYKTGRTRGKVVTVTGGADIDYDDPQPHTQHFSGQIFIQGVGEPFSDRGDSGSVIVEEQSGKIVGLLFGAENSTSAPAKPPAERFTFANQIADVIAALGITFPTGKDPADWADAPASLRVAAAAPPPGLLDEFSRRLAGTADGETLLDAISTHSQEVVELINHNRGVTVAWHRGQGPAWLAAFARGARHDDYRLPDEIEGITRAHAVGKLHATLLEHGSPELRADLHGLPRAVLAVLAECETVDELFIALERQPRAMTTEQRA